MGSVQPGDVVDGWTLDHNIGSGSFATVWRAHKAGLEGDSVAAIKVITTDKLSAKLKQSLECEVSILKRIDHSNVVKLHDVVEERNRLYLVMEFCGGGDLAGYLRRHRRVPEEVARGFMQQLAAGLRELWRHHFVHRDLKPQNLLLSEATEQPLVKIADFGFARDLQPQRLADTLCGSPLYMAPEILQFHKYDAKADLWSVGVILYELVVGKPPFDGGNHVQLLRNIERGEARVPEYLAIQLSRACTGLIHSLLQRNPVERISFEEFFSHPFITGEEPPPPPPPVMAAPSPAAAFGVLPGIPSGARLASSGSGEDQLQFSVEAVEPDSRGARRLVKMHSEPVNALARPRWQQLPTGGKYFAGLKAAGRAGGLPQPGDSAVLADSLEEEDDYVIIERAPSAPACQRDRGGSGRYSQSAPGAGSFRGAVHVPPPPPPLTVPLVVSPAAAGTATTLDTSLARIRFTAGLPRGESLRRVALLLEDLAVLKQQSREAGQSLALRLLSLQVLGLALESGEMGEAAAASDAHAHMRLIADRAHQVGALLQAAAAPVALPDAWDVLYRCALGLAKSAAVDELLANYGDSLRSYAKAGALFYFLLVDGPQLELQPKLQLGTADERRLRRFTVCVAMRHQGCATALASDRPGLSLPGRASHIHSPAV